MVVTAKQLDDLRAKVEAKRAQVAKVEAELLQLEADLQAKAQQFMAECGINAVAKKPIKKTAGVVSSNAKAKAVITKMIGKRKKLEIKKPEKEEIAAAAGCSIKEVEATLKAEFIGYPIGKGRKGIFGLKQAVSR